MLRIQRICCGWLVGLVSEGLWDNISVYIGPLPREREKEKITGRCRKNFQTAPSAPTASIVGPCPTLILISRMHRHLKLPSTVAQLDHYLDDWLRNIYGTCI